MSPHARKRTGAALHCEAPQPNAGVAATPSAPKTLPSNQMQPNSPPAAAALHGRKPGPRRSYTELSNSS
jgi:hypothetical protein